MIKQTFVLFQLVDNAKCNIHLNYIDINTNNNKIITTQSNCKNVKKNEKNILKI